MPTENERGKAPQWRFSDVAERGGREELDDPEPRCDFGAAETTRRNADGEIPGRGRHLVAPEITYLVVTAIVDLDQAMILPVAGSSSTKSMIFCAKVFRTLQRSRRLVPRAG